MEQGISTPDDFRRSTVTGGFPEPPGARGGFGPVRRRWGAGRDPATLGGAKFRPAGGESGVGRRNRRGCSLIADSLGPSGTYPGGEYGGEGAEGHERRHRQARPASPYETGYEESDAGGEEREQGADDQGGPVEPAEVGAEDAGPFDVAGALAQVGTPYIWGGETPGVGFDCSGLVQAAYKVAGITLPRVAQDQYDAGPQLPPGTPPEPGDLVFFGGSASDIGHVGLYVGVQNGQ